jgi:acetyltransferase
VVFGQGGVAAKVFRDQAVGLPPLNMTLAKELIQRTRISKLLEGYQGMESADTDSIRLTLVQLSQLVIDVPEITGLSINPLLADHSGVLVLDAQIEVAPTQQSGPARLAIRPYPQHLEEWTTLKDGTEILMRPIRPEDEHSHLDFFNKLSEEDRRMRFFGFVHEMPHSQLAKFTQIDYDREMAFVAVRTGEDGEIETLGVNRAYFDPDNVEAEFAVVSRTDIKGVGLGTLLMDKMVRYCVNRGTKELVAYTLKENDAMKALGRKFGASVRVLPDDPDTIELRIPLEGNEKIERG